MNITQNAVSFIITGTNFNTRAGANLVFLSSGTAKVTAQTSTQLTITFLTQPNLGPLYAVIKNPRKKSTKVRVATVVAGIVVTPNSDSRAITATALAIAGTGFSATANHNTVTFNLGAAGTVTSATTTLLIITFSTQPNSLGSLTAVVAVSSSNGNSGSPVQVATIVAVATVTENLTIMPRNARYLYDAGPPPTVTYFTRPFIISGTGFNPIANQNSLTFNKGAVGTVTEATATELTVEFALTSGFHLANYPTSDGALTCNVESFEGTSNTATIATVVANSIRFILDENNPLNYFGENFFFDPADENNFDFGGELDPVKINWQNVSVASQSGSFEVHKPGVLNVDVVSLHGYGNGYFVIYYYEHISGYNYEAPIEIFDHTGPYGNSWTTSSNNSFNVAINDVVVIHWDFEEIGQTSLQEIIINAYFDD